MGHPQLGSVPFEIHGHETGHLRAITDRLAVSVAYHGHLPNFGDAWPRTPGNSCAGTVGWLVGWLNCCFTFTETVGLLGTGARDVHLDFHTAPELWVRTARSLLTS